MNRITVRISRKDLRICGRCRAAIERGEKYLEHVISPDHDDIGNTKWWREVECLECAARYGRWPSSAV